MRAKSGPGTTYAMASSTRNVGRSVMHRMIRRHIGSDVGGR